MALHKLLVLATVIAISGLAFVHAKTSEGAGTVQVAIDIDISGNGDNVLGSTEPCNQTPLDIGDTLEVDVVVRGIPPALQNEDGITHDGIAGFEFNFLFDPSVIHVQAVAAFSGPTILKADPPTYPAAFLDFAPGIDNREPPPGTEGDVLVTLLDGSSNAESGDGVLTRVTLKAVGEGVSRLELQYSTTQSRLPQVYAFGGDPYDVNSSSAAIVVASGSCDQAPGPYPTATPFDSTTGTPSPPTPIGSYSVSLEPSTVAVGQDATVTIKGTATEPGVAYYFVELLIDHASLISCTSTAYCDASIPGMIALFDQTGHVRKGDLELAKVTVHVDSPGIVLQLGVVTFQDLNGDGLQPLSIGNAYVTTAGVTPPPFASPAKTSPSFTATPSLTASPTLSSAVLAAALPRGGAEGGSGKSVLPVVGLLVAAVAVGGGAFWISRLRRSG